MSAMPLVSILTPTYGRPGFLRRAVEIFLAYRYPEREMIVVDDSPAPAELPSSPLVKYFHLKERTGLGKKHNLAADLAQGEILMHQDDDDLYFPNRIEIQAEPLAIGEADLSGFIMNFILVLPEARFYHFRAGEKFDQTTRPNRPDFRFHDATGAYHRRVLEAGLQYSDAHVAQKVHFFNDAMRAGFREITLANRDRFVYVRHVSNTWQFDPKVLSPAPRPSWVSDQVLGAHRKAVA